MRPPTVTTLGLLTRAAIVSTLIAAVALFPRMIRAQGGGSRAGQDPLASARELADCLASGDAHVSRHRRTGAVRYVGMDAGRSIVNPRPFDAASSPEAAARAYLSVCGSLFGVADQSSDLIVTKSETVDANRRVLRFQQLNGGVPVIAGELNVDVDGAGNVRTVAGKTLPTMSFGANPTIAPSTAASAAIATVARTYSVTGATLSTSSPELWIFAPSLIGPDDGPARFVWRMEVISPSRLDIREFVLVDAVRGSIALQFNQVETIKNRLTYTAGNTSTLPGTLICNESNPACTGGDADAVAAHLYAGDTYDFYQTNFGRDSLNNLGMTLVSSVHYGPVGFQNAFWNGAQMAYGDAFSQSDDVVGHELSHGVTQFTSNLFYYYQSGAINESLSDVFGEFIDQTNGHGNDAPGVRWLLGEDIPGVGAIRNMQNPPAFGNPDKMTSPIYYAGAADNGGVHYNSGINNKAAYLMVDGGAFNGQTIAGLGIPKVAKIYYEVETHLLTSGSDYADLGDALNQGCANLVGTAGITLGDCDQVRNAVLAVEMALQPVPGFNPEAPLCGIGQTPASVFFDNLEGGAGNFVMSAAVGPIRWRLDSPYGAFAHSGQHFLYADDYPAAAADSSVATAAGIVIPPNAFLHFAHAYGFQTPNFDGGVVEYSSDGGTTWNDAGPLFDFNGYSGTLAGGSGNPLAGRPAFVGASHGYMSSRVNLSSLAGQTLRFRWRMALDSATYDWGWWLDDVRVYSCAGAQITQVVPNTGAQAQAGLTVGITGQSTHFVQGVTFANFGAGITINGLAVTDSTHALMNISIAPTAALGPRDLLITTGSELAGGFNLFTVVPSPLLLQLVPNRGQPGANLLVAVKGQLTHFAAGSTTANFGAGITVNGVNVVDSTHATVDLTILPGATGGTRTVTMTTGAESATLANGFAVVGSAYDTPAYAYIVGRRLSPSQGGTDGTQTVSVIDTSTNAVVATIPVGVGCSCVGSDGAAISPDGALVYVANEIDNTVSVVRTATNSVIATIRVGSGPIAVAAGPDGSRVYVVNGSGTTSVSVIDTATNAIVNTIPLGVVQARGVAVTPDGGRLYVSTYGTNTLKVIDTATNAVTANIPVGNLPLSVDVMPNGAMVYVGNLTGNSVSAVSTATNTVVATIPTGSSTYGARVTPDGGRAYVAMGGSGMPVINTVTSTVFANVAGAAGSRALRFIPDGTRAYVASYQSVYVVNSVTNTLITSIPFTTAANGDPLSMTMSAGPTRVVSLGGSLAFGNVHVGSTATATLTIRNAGDSPLTVSGLTFPPGFSGNWAGGVIPGGAAQNVTVTFAPTSNVGYGGVVTVNSNRTSGANTMAVSGTGILVTLTGDFDGDRKTDITVYRPSNGRWYVLQSASGFSSWSEYSWGVSTDTPVPGDYDGDGKVDLAVYRPSTGYWFVRFSSTNFATTGTFAWGAPGDVPVPGDYDGDGKTDVAIYRPSAGYWFVLKSSTNYSTWGTYQWGTSSDLPVPGDYDGDGRTDIAVYRPSAGVWFILRSNSNFTQYNAYTFGTNGDVPVPGDYDGDGKVDLALYRPLSGVWYVARSSTNFSTWNAYQWGAGADVPVPGDYDGDGKFDVAVFRPATGHWFILKSSTNFTNWATYQWGTSTDIPVLERQ